MERSGSSTIEQRALLALVVSAALIGIALRAWHLFAEPLWLDEAYSAYAAGRGFAFLWQIVPSYETHPPFYYSLLRLWTLAFGDGLVPQRALGLVAGIATPPLLGLAADGVARLLDLPTRLRWRLIAVTFLLACLSNPLIEMSREVRPYPLMILLYAVGARALTAIGRARRKALPRAAFAVYLAVAALLLWLHNLGPLWAAALGLGLLAMIAGRGFDRRDWAWLIGGHLLVGLLYLPGLAILLDQAPTWVASTWVTFTTASLWPRLATLYAVPGWQSIAAFMLASLGAAGLWSRGDTGRRLLGLLLALALVPVLLSVGLTIAVAPVFIARTMTPVAVPTLILLALGLVLATGRTAWAGWAAGAMLAANLLAVDVQSRAAGPMQDWYRTLDWLGQRFRSGDRILAYPNEGALPIERAIRDRGLGWPVRPIPGPMPARDPSGWHPTGSRGVVSLPPWRLHQIATAPETQAIPTIWLLRLGAETYDPGDVFLHELSVGRHVVRSWKDGPIEIVGLRK